MGREFPRFLFSNPQNTKSKGPFIIHTLDPFSIIRVSVLDSSELPNSGKYPWDKDEHFLYEVVETQAESQREAFAILGFAIEWYQNQPEYKTSFKEWQYTLVDDNGAVGFTAYYKYSVEGKFITYGYLYKVSSIENDMIIADRIRVANSEDHQNFRLFGPQ